MNAPAASLALRSRAAFAVRRFFHERGFTEVDTPVRLPAPALETHLDAAPAGDRWLRTSPELHMKRLLAAGHERIFQLGPCFRRGESGPLHHPEFTMLEWYRAGADQAAMLEDTRALLPYVAREAAGSARIVRHGVAVALDGPWETIRVADAFRRWAGWDPVGAFDADRFDLDLVDRVEPALPRDRPVVLADYPAPLAALARLNPADPRVAERWELYVGGIELANAYSELADPAAQRARFEACARARRAAGREAYPVDEPFLAALERGMPPSGGIALGFDRLVLLLAGAETLDGVIAFRED